MSGASRFVDADPTAWVMPQPGRASPAGRPAPVRPATFAEPPPAAVAGPDGQRAAELLGTTQAAGVKTLTEVADRAVRRLLMLPRPETAATLFDDAELQRIAGSLAGSIAAADLLGRARVRRRAELHERATAFAESDPGPPGPAPRPGLTWKRETQRWVRKGTDHAAALAKRAKDAPAALKTKVSAYVARKYATLEQRYGPAGAKAVMAAGLLMLPVPIPGSTFVPVALAEAVRALAKGVRAVTRNAEDPVTDELAQAVIEFITGVYAEAGEPAPPLDPARVRAALERDEVDDDETPVSTFAEQLPTDPFHDFAEPVPAVEPEAAVEYFRRLVPALGTDPGRYGPMLARHAFTLAVATEQTLLERVKKAIADHLVKGTDGTPDIQDILDAAGVSPRNPAYAETVWRTNVMSQLNEGANAELQTPEMQEAFPAFEYNAIVDGRGRPEHTARNGRLYPSSVPWVKVRGLGIEDAANCRCGFTPIYKTEFAERLKRGERVETTW